MTDSAERDAPGRAPSSARRPRRPPSARRPAPPAAAPAAPSPPTESGAAAAAASPESLGAPAPAAPPRTGRRRGPRTAREPRPHRPQALIDTAGPDPGTPLEEVRLQVGVVSGVHGIRGEVKMRLTTDDPERLSRIKRVYVGEEAQPRRLQGVRFHAGDALLRLAGVRTPEEGRALAGQPVRIAGSDARPLAEGEFYLYQIVGLRAVTESGEDVGVVSDVIETGANDVFVITPDAEGPELLLPNHPDVVLEISPRDGRLIFRPLVYYDDPSS